MRPALLACLLLCSATALAAPPAKVLDVDTFLDQQRDVREDFEHSRKFKHVAAGEKQRLYRAQDEMFSLLEGRRSVDELSTDQRIALYNAQEVVSSVLLEAELDREVCKREKVLGSHRSSLVCTTVREQRQMKEMARDMLLAPRVCDVNCGGF
jgi:hypothetical protein